MRNRFKFFLIVLALTSIAACREEATDDYVALTGKVFIFNPRVASATYVVTLGKLKPIPENSRVVALFEDPAGGEKIRVEQKVWPKLAKIALETRSLTCIRKGKAYAFNISLIGPDDQELQTISSTLTSSLDQSVMPDRPLVVGPAYTPNPELKGDPAGKIAGEEHNCPAA